ncbi:MAG: hypothetical protein LQ340_000249 [Diploschistes diacapsis]|nr:MAG: hypothetical protein LQ340_000249 [Diploschistes diacapsis]
MGIFSKRKDARKAVEAATATQEDPSTLQLDTGRPLPRFESSTSTVATGSPPPVIQKSCLKRASKSEGSICLTMYAANDRFARQSQTILITTAACDTPRPSLRSSSTSRMRKQVSFKLDDAHLPQSKPLFQARRPRPVSKNDDSDAEDGHDARSISSLSSTSSCTTVESDAPAMKPSMPIRPTRVASGFERRMSKLPPVQNLSVRPRPKITLGHSKDGHPSWSLKARPRTLAAR